MNLFNRFGKGGSAPSRGVRFFGKTLVAGACALSLALVGCSQKAGNPSKVVVPTTPEVPTKVVTKLDSLVKANAGQGKGVITGFLTGEGKTIAQGLLKQASNAGGERRLLQKEEIPLTGATILIFDALKPTTVADATLKTDSLGNYTGVLAEGKYFGFAVYLDLETFQLVTTSIPNMNPRADTIVRMDTAIAIEDVTSPAVAGVYDANMANADGIFLVGSVPDKNAKLTITFSEPMNRESAKGVILGRIDTSNTSTSMVLADTVKDAKLSWNGDSKELTLFAPALSLGAQYGMIIPTTLKDLAKNPLEKEYKATFVTIASADMAAIKFAVSATFPADKEALKPIQNPGVSFNRPVETFSLLKGATIEPAVNGYWEVSGARAVFIHKEPLAVGRTYTVTLPRTVVDLSGAGLENAFTYAFTVKDFEGAAKNNTGKEQQVALSVETAFDAYLSGDVGRFAAAFHQNFRLYNESGKIKSKTEFLDMIRADVGERQAMAAGYPGPVFDNSEAACKDRAARWKVAAEGGTADDEIWVDAYVNPGQSPRAYDKDKREIPVTSLTWDPTGPRFTYKGKKYGFGPDMSRFKGPVNMDAAKGDMRFMGDMLRQASTVVLEPVKFEGREEFKVDTSVTISGDTARLAVKMIGYEKFNRLNFGDINRACEGRLVDTNFQVLKFTLVFDGSKWLVTSIVEPIRTNNIEDFNKAVDTRDFNIKQILPITLVSPTRDNSQDAAGKVTFRFKGPAFDSIGGYLVGIAEDPKFCFGRPPYGALIYVKASNTAGGMDSLILNSAGGVESPNAAAILRRVMDLKLPGWERCFFDNALTTLYDAEKGFGGVYNWKVIAIKDTSAVSFLANGFTPDRFYAESDFGPVRGYFAAKGFPHGAAFATLETNQQNYVNTQPVTGNNSFSDMDLDGVPDGIEMKYKTDPRDRNSFPNFRIDTDGDGLADFLEALLDPRNEDSLVTRKADAAGVKGEIEKLRALGIVWEDTDADGFPNDIEMMAGFNPNDPRNNPGTTIRANAPIGVFAGKFQMGASLNTISLKLFTDSLKALLVKYTAIIGRDTLIDSLKTAFNENTGEVYIPLILPMNGPDAGRALLLRGKYDANMSLLMGPIDMIAAPAKGSTNFGSGPYIGQFAASGRGEDVSRFLPGANGTTGPIVNNPINTQPMGLTYRMPPSGTKEGALVILDGTTITMLNEFQDTLAVIANLNFRGQPDGSFEFQGQSRVAGAFNSWKRSEVGGRIMFDGRDSWVVDGHFFQESDSAGIHKSYPGQFCAKALKAELVPKDIGVTGTLKGWIAQDKTGAGFTGPVVNQPCDPNRAACTTQPVCDPSRGPCPTEPVCDPSKGPCTTPPVNTFSKAFMAGTAVYKQYLMRYGFEAGEYFHVSIQGQVFRVKYDSAGFSDAKSPMCGHVVFVPEAIPAKSDSAHHKTAFEKDVLFLRNIPTGAIIIAIEDQFMVSNPARMDKARDNQGDIHSNVFVAENRPTQPGYGTSTMVCPVNNGPIVNQPCDPTKGFCPPVDTTRCDPTRMTCPPVDTAKCDPTRMTCTQPCDPARADCLPPCDPAKGPCGPVTQGPKFPAYMGTLDNLKLALVASQNQVGMVKDSNMNVSGRITINPGSIFVDQMSRMTIVTDVSGTTKLIVLSEPTDPMKVLIRDGVPLAMPRMNEGGIPPGGDTTKPIVTNPPGDTANRPVPFKGSLSTIQNLLSSKGWMAMIATPQGPVPVKVADATLKTDGTIITAGEVGSARIFVVMGDRMDAFKPALTPAGDLLVMEKPVTAGQ